MKKNDTARRWMELVPATALLVSMVSLAISIPSGLLAKRALSDWAPPGRTSFGASAELTSYHSLVPGRWELRLADRSRGGSFLVAALREGDIVDVRQDRMTFFPRGARLGLETGGGEVSIQSVTSESIWLSIEYGDVLTVINYSGELVQAKP